MHDVYELNGQAPEDMNVEPPAEQSPEPELNGSAMEETKAEKEEPPAIPDTPILHDGTPDYKAKYILSGHARSISAIKFSPDGTMLASCGESYGLLVL